MGSAKIVYFLLLVLAAGFLQHSSLLNVFGVKPNLMLVGLTALSFFVIEFRYYAVLLAVGLIMGRFGGAPEIESAALGFFALTAFAVGKRLPWRWIFNNAMLAGAGTVVFYLMVRPPFLYNNGASVIIELFINILVGTLIFLFNK